jgi:hypothetical protein
MVNFRTKNRNLGQILEGVAIEDVGIFYGHLAYFTSVRYILWAFGIFYGHLVYFMVIWYILWALGIFFRFGMLYQEKSGNPAENFVFDTYVRKGANSPKFFRADTAGVTL